MGSATLWNETEGILSVGTHSLITQWHNALNPDMFNYFSHFFSLKLLLCLPKLNHGSSSSCHVAVSISFNHGVGHKGPEHGMAFIIWGSSKGGGKKGKAKGNGKGDEQNHENPGALSDNDWRLWKFWSLKWTGVTAQMFPGISKLFFLSCSLLVSTFVAWEPWVIHGYSLSLTMPDRCTFPTFHARCPTRCGASSYRQWLVVETQTGNGWEWTGIYRYIWECLRIGVP